MFSPSVPQATTSKNETLSSHALVCRFCQRRFTAKPKLATPLSARREP
jgi:hypothetical protein